LEKTGEGSLKVEAGKVEKAGGEGAGDRQAPGTEIK